MRDDEVRVVHVHIQADRREKQSRQPAHGEEPDEAHGVEHRRVPRNRALVHRRRPVEDLDGRRNRHQEAERREDQRRVHGLARDEQVVSPHEKARARAIATLANATKRVAEHRLAAEGGHELADDPHRRQHHDVDGRVRVEPEQVLEEHRIAAERRIEEPEVEQPLGGDEQHRDREHRRAEHEDHARGVHRPEEQRHAEPRHAGRAHPVDRDDEVETGQDRRKAGDEDAERRRDDIGRRRHGAERRVERPPGVHTAGDQRVEREEPAEDVDVPAREVQLREREILRADHDRHEEIAERRRNRRNQKEEHHHHAVHGEELVVGLVGDEIAGRRRQLEADHDRERPADEEEEP